MSTNDGAFDCGVDQRLLKSLVYRIKSKSFAGNSPEYSSRGLSVELSSSVVMVETRYSKRDTDAGKIEKTRRGTTGDEELARLASLTQRTWWKQARG